MLSNNAKIKYMELLVTLHKKENFKEICKLDVAGVIFGSLFSHGYHLTLEELVEIIERNFNFQGTTHYLIEMSGDIVGWIALMNQRTDHRVVEIGNVYFSHLMKRSKAATEVIYLLLKTCFEQGFRRVEWKCDDLNVPSKKAALRFGFCFEGIFRQDRISKGRNRNTAWFSILDEEWIALKKAYEAWLSADNFDEKNAQKVRLEEFKRQYT